MSILNDPLTYYESIRLKYGPIARLKLRPPEMVLLQGADGIRQILWEIGAQYPKPELGMSTVEPLLGHSVATLTDGVKWEEARKIVLPLFSAKCESAWN